jgi:hypothetical protein
MAGRPSEASLSSRNQLEVEMTKPLVTKLFVGGVVTGIAGAVVCVVAVVALFGTGAFVLSGADVVGFNSTPSAWALVGLCVAGCIAMFGGVIAGLVSWIGALLNTAGLESKAWFVALLLLGIWSLGFFAMIAYVAVGPDSTERQLQPFAAGA